MMDTGKIKTNKPDAKMQATGITGAAGILIIYAAQQMGYQISAEVAGAIVLVASWLAGWWKTDPRIDAALKILDKAVNEAQDKSE